MLQNQAHFALHAVCQSQKTVYSAEEQVFPDEAGKCRDESLKSASPRMEFKDIYGIKKQGGLRVGKGNWR